MTRDTVLYLDICDYDENPVCAIYDNQSDISGQATNVHIIRERNGWKELSFEIPTTCMSDEGEILNFRLDYLIAEYRIRAITEDETDWFIISEPKITHNAFSRNVSVTAGHISILLKNKSLDLELSEEEGNNVGSADAMLATILEGSSWSPGYVYPFKEDNGTIMVRSISGQAGTGARNFIEKLCDVFEAKPIYHGDTKTVDLIPMNPFAKIDPDKIIEHLDDMNVFELVYDRNIHNVEKTTNTENMATRLYAYGNSGDINGACTLQNAEHNEYWFVISETAAEYTFYADDTRYYFTGDVSVGDSLVWSDMDITSKLYIWNDSKNVAYEVYSNPHGAYIDLGSPEPEIVKNQFPYLLGLKYYKDVGLLSDAKLQETALFQRVMPGLYERSQELAALYTESEYELSRVGESNSGFLKLRVAEYDLDNGATKVILDVQDDQGVIYRTDYDEAERRYFQWHVASQLKPNGESVTNIGSVLLVVHDTDPVTFDKVYLKKIYDQNGDLVVNSEGEPGDFEYKYGDYPSAITVWGNLRYDPNDRFYLFCSNSMSGSLGSKTAEDEAVIDNLENTTLDGSEKHPTYFAYSGDPIPEPNVSSYGWFYKQYRDLVTIGELYFCWKAKGDLSWHKACVGHTAPAVTNGDYFFNLKYKTLWHGENGAWVKLESAAEQRVANMFTKVFYYCRRRDMLYKGLYEYYTRMCVNLPVANYAIPNDFAFYWVFTTDQEVTGNLRLDVIQGQVWQDNDINHIVTSNVVPYDTVFYPSENELAECLFINGSISMSNGVEEDSSDMVRTSSIKTWESTTYEYNLPPRSFVMFYDVNLNYLSGRSLTGDQTSSGTFTTAPRTKYLRIVSSVPSTGYVRVQGYDKKFYINDKVYNILDNIDTDGELLGICTLTKKFADLADVVYGEYLINLRESQQEIRDRDAALSDALGDMLKDGRWQDSNYVSGDEKRLYDDATYMHKQVSMPEISYSFTYLSMFGVHNEHYYETHNVKWPEISILDIAHLIDTEIDANCWAYVDKVDRCYDAEWKTTISIDTKLTLASRHSFTDVIARIAEIAKETKAKQSQYETAISGPVDSARLVGAIDMNQTILNGGASNYHTDDKGNIIFESADGLSAMILGGRGIGIANSKNPSTGDWAWRSAITGYGLNADQITTGAFSAERIEAHSITADKLMSNVGQMIDIGSNKAVQLFATVNGSRPAGTVLTTDALISIQAGYEEAGEIVPAKIDILSGGELNLEGGNIDIHSHGELNLRSDADFHIRAKGADTIDSTADGLYLGTDGINFGGGKFKVAFNGNTSTVNMTAGYVAIGTPGDEATIITVDNSVGKINIVANNEINIASNQTLQLISNGGHVLIGNGTSPFTIGADVQTYGNESYDRAYIYNGRTHIQDNSHDGVYLGTDGINVGKVEGSHVIATPEGSVDISGTIYASAGEIGSWLIGDTLYSMDTDQYGRGSYIYLGAIGDYRMLAGTRESSEDDFVINFSLEKDGTLTTTKGHIGGWTIGSDYIGNNSYKNGSTVGMAHIAPNGQNNIVFWAGGNYNGTLAGNDEPTFWVKKDGTIRAVLGMIGGWYIGSDYIGNADSKANSTLGMASYGILSDDAKVFWAGGGYTASPNFYVTRGGFLYAKNADIAGKITATDGEIAGWKISTNTLTGNKVGLAKTSGDSQIAIWAGDSNAGDADFKVYQSGKMIAKGAEIRGSTFIVTNEDGTTTQFKIDGATGNITMAAGWYIDPNDISGPLSGTEVNKESTGYVNLNCNATSGNPRLSIGPITTSLGEYSSPFRVYSDGRMYFNNQGPAVIITNLSSSGIEGYKYNSPTKISASFFDSSRLGVGVSGGQVYPKYAGTSYTSQGSSAVYDEIYGDGWDDAKDEYYPNSIEANSSNKKNADIYNEHNDLITTISAEKVWQAGRDSAPSTIQYRITTPGGSGAWISGTSYKYGNITIEMRIV